MCVMAFCFKISFFCIMSGLRERIISLLLSLIMCIFPVCIFPRCCNCWFVVSMFFSCTRLKKCGNLLLWRKVILCFSIHFWISEFIGSCKWMSWLKISPQKSSHSKNAVGMHWNHVLFFLFRCSGSDEVSFVQDFSSTFSTCSCEISIW